MFNSTEFVILYGPPGSGKSTLATELYPNYTTINVDDILAHTQEFIAAAATITAMITEGIDRTQIEKQATYIYQSFRDAADRKSEILLHRAITAHNNIVFEITGGSESAISYLEKIITLIKAQGYWIKLIFPHAPVSLMQSRVYTRGLSTGRLPSRDLIASSYAYACDHFHFIRGLCNEVAVADSTVTPTIYIYHCYGDRCILHDRDRLAKLPLNLTCGLFE